MSQRLGVDIAIVGGGVAGASLALALKDSRLSVALIDRGSLQPKIPDLSCGIEQVDPRVFALNLASWAFLASIGIVLEDQRRFQPFNRLFVSDASSLGQLEMKASEIGESTMGAIVEHKVLLYSLYQKLQASNAACFEGVTIDSLRLSNAIETPSEITLADGTVIVANLIVGADGAESWIRKETGFSTNEWDYGHRAIVCTVACEKPHQKTAWQTFRSDGPLAFLPLPAMDDQPAVSIVWSIEEEKAAELLALSDQDFLSELANVSENWLGELTGVTKRFSFPLRQRHAKTYYQPGVVLVADAAHTIHPLAGQGMNLGLQDVSVLSQELLQAIKANESLADPKVLSRYQRKRKMDNLSMMAAVEGFKRVFEQKTLPAGLLRHLGMAGFDALPPLKRKIIHLASGR
ncbi:MAG: UbiH/UbiF/VisC/COQ6 family ubiquinone biosynthesis hydroxylase [Cellvibrionales bacterium]|nr:UbiH/UbiF/VisC/COQ6 family ubiquinone biosynthesis hydroxylase [Cellvibrionales bacterium]